MPGVSDKSGSCDFQNAPCDATRWKARRGMLVCLGCWPAAGRDDIWLCSNTHHPHRIKDVKVTSQQSSVGGHTPTALNACNWLTCMMLCTHMNNKNNYKKNCVCQRPRMLLLLLLLLFFTIIVSYPRPHMPPLSCHLSGDCIAFGGRCVFTLAALTEASLPPHPLHSHPLPLLLFFTQCPHPQYVGLLQKLHLPDSVSSIHTGVVAHGPQACTVYNLSVYK